MKSNCARSRDVFTIARGESLENEPDGSNITYNRIPLLPPPSESHWCGRKRGGAVHEGLDYFITCAIRNTRIYIRQCISHNTENGFRGALLDINERSLRCFLDPAFMKPGYRKHRNDHSNIDIPTFRCFCRCLLRLFPFLSSPFA